MIIEEYGGWKSDVLKRLRAIILNTVPIMTEEVKWKTASRPEGLPVWEYNGILCFAETWKDNIKLIFFKGSRLTDSGKLFNARLRSSTIRAIEIHEGDICQSITTDLVKNLVGLPINTAFHGSLISPK